MCIRELKVLCGQISLIKIFTHNNVLQAAEAKTHFGLFPSALKWQMACELSERQIAELLPMARMLDVPPMLLWQIKQMDKGIMERPPMVDNKFTR